jgi:hypothetical protein
VASTPPNPRFENRKLVAGGASPKLLSTPSIVHRQGKTMHHGGRTGESVHDHHLRVVFDDDMVNGASRELVRQRWPAFYRPAAPKEQ